MIVSLIENINSLLQNAYKRDLRNIRPMMHQLFIVSYHGRRKSTQIYHNHIYFITIFINQTSKMCFVIITYLAKFSTKNRVFYSSFRTVSVIKCLIFTYDIHRHRVNLIMTMNF